MAVAKEQMAWDSWRAGGVHSMDLSQSPHDAPLGYCLLCSVVRLHLYSCGLTSNIKPIWKVTARFKLAQAAINNFAAFTTILEGKGFITERLGTGWRGAEMVLLGLGFCSLVCIESSVVYSKLNAPLSPQVAFSNQTLEQGREVPFIKT